jgi:hypothetical protein
MAKTLVFEGCPTCEVKHHHASYDGFGAVMAFNPAQKAAMMNMIQGGAIGAGGATILDFIMPKVPFLNNLPATIRPLINGGVSIIAGIYVSKKNPNIGLGIGLGGASIAAYKFIATILGKVATTTATAGLGAMGKRGISVYNDGGTGVIVPVAMQGYGDEVLID